MVTLLDFDAANIPVHDFHYGGNNAIEIEIGLSEEDILPVFASPIREAVS